MVFVVFVPLSINFSGEGRSCWSLVTKDIEDDRGEDEYKDLVIIDDEASGL